MLIDKNIKNILGGGYNVSEVKYMDKTVWSAGKNITIEIVNNFDISVIIGRQYYNRGTYSLKLADDEDLRISVSGKVPETKLEHEGDVIYKRIHFMTMYIESSNGRTIDSYRSNDNYNLYDIYISENRIIPFTKFKNGDKLTIIVEINYYLNQAN